MEEMERKWISGFWRRIGALFIDTLILGFAGFALGQVLESTFVEIGAWGRLIGFAIALVYFGVMNSSISKGQTVGKKVLKIKVVDSSGEPISLARSFVRYSVLAIPFSLNGAHFTNEALLSYLIYPFSLIVFGGLFSILYLYIFNRVTRQSLHDLAVGTYVVNSGALNQGAGTVWKPHLIVVSVLFVAAAVIPVVTANIIPSQPFKDLLTTQEALNNNLGVTYASVSSGYTTFSSSSEGSKTTTYINAQVFLSEDNVSDVELARKLAKVVVSTYSDSTTKNVIQIILTYGYDIGIWAQWSNYTHSFNPAELHGSE